MRSKTPQGQEVDVEGVIDEQGRTTIRDTQAGGAGGVPPKALPPAPGGGASPKRPGDTGNPRLDTFIRRNKRLPGEGWLAKKRADWGRVQAAAKSSYERLQDKGEYAEVMRDLDWFKQSFDLAAGKQFRLEREYYRGLSPAEFDVLETARVLRDMKGEIDTQRQRHLDAGGKPDAFEPRVPNEITEADVSAGLAAINPRVTAKIEAALKKEKDGDRAVLDDLFRARGGVTGEEPTKLDRDDWFHHMVALYQEGRRSAQGARAPGRTPGKLGALKTREGSTLDYVTGVIESRRDWMPAASRQTRLYDFVKKLEDRHDITRDVYWHAMVANDPAMEGAWAALAGGKLDDAAAQKLATDKLTALAKDGMLPDTMAKRWLPLIAELRRGQPLSPEALQALPEYARWLTTQRTIKGAKVARSAARAQALKKATGRASLRPEDILRLPEYASYTGWSAPRGHILKVTRSLPEHLMDHALDELGKALKVDTKAAREGLGTSGMILPSELAETLNQIGQANLDDFHTFMDRGARSLTSKWKWHRLINPLVAVPYWFNNARSGINSFMRGNVQAFAKWPRAWAEVRRLTTSGRSSSPDLEGWLEEGGLAALLESKETGAFTGFAPLTHFQNRGGRAAWLAHNAGTAMRWLHVQREATERYASYLAFLDDIRRHGRPTRIPASIKEEVLALPTPEAQAFRLSQDLAVDYVRTTELGEWLAGHLPFYRYQDGNYRREKQMWANAMADPNLTAAVGRHYAGASVPIAKARQIGRVAMGAIGFELFSHAYNNTLYGEDEERLDPKTRWRPHLFLPTHGADGKRQYIDFLGNASDLLGWVGLDNTFGMGYLDSYLNGRMTVPEMAQDMGKSLLNRFVGAVSPIYKAPAEFLLKRSFHPDATRSRPVKDPWEPVLEMVNAGWIKRWAEGRPLREDRWAGMFRRPFKEIDPDEGVYYFTRNQAAQWLAQHNPNKAQQIRDSADTPRSNALYQAREAKDAGDTETAMERMWEYVRNGGDEESWKAGILATEPLKRFGGAEEEAFLKSLSPADRAMWQRAYDFWRRKVAPTSEPVAATLDLPDYIRESRRTVGRWADRNNEIRELLRSDPGRAAEARELDRQRARDAVKR